jgi:hypothetical protein
MRRPHGSGRRLGSARRACRTQRPIPMSHAAVRLQNRRGHSPRRLRRHRAEIDHDRFEPSVDQHPDDRPAHPRADPRKIAARLSRVGFCEPALCVPVKDARTDDEDRDDGAEAQQRPPPPGEPPLATTRNVVSWPGGNLALRGVILCLSIYPLVDHEGLSSLVLDHHQTDRSSLRRHRPKGHVAGVQTGDAACRAILHNGLGKGGLTSPLAT